MKEPTLSNRTISDYIAKYYPDLLFWDGIGKHQKRVSYKFYKHRQGMPNEIRIEFDSEDTNKNWENINQTAINLWNASYSFAIFYVEGGRSPHLHIYDIDELDNHPIEKRNLYREKFLNKFCPKGSKPDLGLCDEKHLCALEFANHFKYNKPKKLLSMFWQGKNQGMDNKIYCEMFFEEEKDKYKIPKLLHKKRKKKFGDTLKDTQRDLIINNLDFETVFDKYKVKYKGKMAVCPFHSEKDGSLSFSNDNGLWKCWGAGCGAKGDIITMIKMLKELGSIEVKRGIKKDE